MVSALKLGRISTMVIDSTGIITEAKSSVGMSPQHSTPQLTHTCFFLVSVHVAIDDRIYDMSSKPASSKSWPILLRAAVLSSNANFLPPAKPKIRPEDLEVEEWDENSGALLRLYECNPPKDAKKLNNLYCEAVRGLFFSFCFSKKEKNSFPFLWHLGEECMG